MKDGKDPKDTVSYRPISLTSCPGKVKEKMTADRLMRELESRGLLNENQAGFRQNRCTTDQILKLVQDASDQIHSPGSNRLIATFYDYEKAYDKVWRDGLIHKMIKLGVPHRFVVYVRQFLATRSTRVEVNGRRSNSFFLKEGLPQGSSISPLLFLIYINDIDVDLHVDTVASLFADDTATWLKDGKVRGEHRDLAQQEVNKIQDWATLWKMRINSSKTKCMITSTSKADRTWNPKLEIDGKQIDLVQMYKFLGTSVENDLRFVENMNAITVKSRKRVNILKCLATKSWGNSLESQRALFIQYTRSVMEYASNSWNGWIADTYRKKLQRVQNEALRSIAGLAKTCPVDFLHLETGVEPIECRLDKNDLITWDRYARLPTSDSRRQLIENDIPPRLKTREGFRERTRKGFEYHNLVRDTTSAPLEPWLEFPNLSFEKVHLERKKEDYSELELNRLSTEKIDSLNISVRIYTDGSTDRKQKNGGAGIYIEKVDPSGTTSVLFEDCWPAGSLCSSYTGECVALLRALEWIESNQVADEYLIATDSKSLQDSLISNDWKDPDPWLKEAKKSLCRIESKIFVLWLPSHCSTREQQSG